MFKLLSRFSFLIFCALIPSSAYSGVSEVLDLGGQWQLENQNRTIKIKAVVPGYVHTALLHNGEIEDPYFRYNDELYRWIDYENWTYYRSFNVQESLVNKTNVVLVSEGLDTIAEVTINGVIIGSSTNMFQRYVWDVKKAIKCGTNEIRVMFTSAVTYSANKSQQYKYPIPPACPPPVQHGECHVNLIRKKQCSFSWDWGPAFASQGIWKNISVQAFNSVLIKDVLVVTKKGSASAMTWNLIVDVIVDCGAKEGSGIVDVLLPKLDIGSKSTIHCKVPGTLQVTLPTITLSDKHGVQTWWPRGYGNQPLYTLVTTFKSNELIETSSKTIRIGFREVELVQEEMLGGLSFFYKVNNISIFMKGANWIPADSFEDRVSDEVIRNLLQSAADANMNIVRNWGGGIYQHDSFYTIADELGLMVWQEFMFACDYYPADVQFLQSVQEEVKDQMHRLQYHPSVVVWSGNNEIESSVTDNWYNVSNLTVYKEDYIKLFINTIRETAIRVDVSRPFVSSSPSNGLESEKEGWISRDPNSDFYGDVHYYNYTMNCLDVQGYPKPRFASEYGLQSLPQFQTLSTVTREEDWSFTSPLLIHRQHHGNGYEQMLNEIQMHFKLPKSKDSLKNFKDMLYLSQVSQAICIKAESEHYRRLRGVIDKGRGHTMGAIYWQLNSIWPAPTWSSLEYGGSWKMLHYYAKDFFAPVLVSPFELNNTLYVFAVSDKLENLILYLRITLWSWHSMKPLKEDEKKIVIGQQSSVNVYEADVDELLKSSSCQDRTKCVATWSMVNSEGQPETPTNVYYFSPLKNVRLLNPQIKVIQVVLIKDKEFLITLEANAIAPFVWLSSGKIPGRFSANGFLITNTSTEVLFYAWISVSKDDLQQAISVLSLFDVYTE